MVEWGEVNQVILNPKHPYSKLLIAAAPDPEREDKVELPVVRDEHSEVTVWTPESKGCPFRTRCPMAEPRCMEELPLIKKISENQYIRCIHS